MCVEWWGDGGEYCSLVLFVWLWGEGLRGGDGVGGGGASLLHEYVQVLNSRRVTALQFA